MVEECGKGMLAEMMVSLEQGGFFFFQGECGRGLSRFVVQGIRFSYTGLELMVILLFYIPRISVYGRVFSIEIL